jgi:peptidoglycan/LPS O-acetylase OafA/YrhL
MSMSVEIETPRPKLLQLEGLRGICALAVLISHLLYGIMERSSIFPLSPYLLTLLSIIGSFAHLAVLTFFMLSGFVIGYTHREPFTLLSGKKYLLKRLVRLYPIYCTSIAISIIANYKSLDILQILGHLFFLQGWTVPLLKVNGPLWSLHYEVMFYLLYLVVWKFNLSIEKSICFCVICSLIQPFVNFHFLSVFGYFTLWLLGVWIAQNFQKMKMLDVSSNSRVFWCSMFLTISYGWINIYSILIRVYGVKYQGYMPQGLPSVVSDVLVSGLVAALLTSILRRRLPFYRILLFLPLIGTLFAVVYGISKGIFWTISDYKIAAIFLALTLLFSILKVRIPLTEIEYFSGFGSISYALYVTHSPIQSIFYSVIPIRNSMFMLFVTNIIILFVSLLISWLLECCIQPRLSSKVKLYFNLI